MKCAWIVGVPLLAFAAWIGYYSIPQREPLKIEMSDEWDWDHFKTHGLRQCRQPVILRNVLKLTESDRSKYRDDTHRKQFMRDRLVDVFGDKLVSCYAMSNLSETKEHGLRHTPDVQEFVSIRDYVTNPKYLDTKYVVNALSHLGSHDEYRRFMQYANDDNHFESMRKLPIAQYMGSQYFIGRGEHTGSHMHFAWGINVFFMLSGQKHWIVVDPEWAEKANCSMGHTGYYGHCWPNSYMGDDQNGQVNITKYLDALKGAGLPRTAYYDFILSPGDMLVNCDLWPHAIENLTPETVAISGRYMPDFTHMTPARMKYTIISVINSLVEKWKNPDAFTFLYPFQAMLTGEIKQMTLFDNDERLKGLGVLNQKDAQRNAETVTGVDGSTDTTLPR